MSCAFVAPLAQTLVSAAAATPPTLPIHMRKTIPRPAPLLRRRRTPTLPTSTASPPPTSPTTPTTPVASRNPAAPVSIPANARHARHARRRRRQALRALLRGSRRAAEQAVFHPARATGAAYVHPAAAGASVACDVVEQFVAGFPPGHGHAVVALGLHLLADLLLASPY